MLVLSMYVNQKLSYFLQKRNRNWLIIKPAPAPVITVQASLNNDFFVIKAVYMFLNVGKDIIIFDSKDTAYGRFLFTCPDDVA